MDRIDFHTRILGRKAANRLRGLNGDFLTFRSKLPSTHNVEVYLDGKKLGNATISLLPVYKLRLSSLTTPLALLGGFDSIYEQMGALKRAGCRFKELGEYTAYPIFFMGNWGKNDKTP